MASAEEGSSPAPVARPVLAPFLAPFSSRSFRVQWPADLCTAWALEMETLILGWYVLVQTGSVLLLTAFGALQFIGTLASPMLGTLADRVGLRRVLASMRFAYAALAGVILLLAASGQLNPWAVLAVAGVAGLLRPSDIGMRTALVGATVPPQHLMAAMGISRTSMDSAKVAGALVGASVVAVFGMVVAYVAITLIHLAGALLTQTNQFVGLNVLGFEPSGELLVMLILGGVGRLYGAFVGPLVFLVAQDFLAKKFPEYWYFGIGLMLVLVVLFARGGILGLIDGWVTRFKGKTA